MARETTWRRSFNVAGTPGPEGSLDLLIVQPEETLGGTWWQYSLRSVGSVQDNATPPLDGCVTVVGLILVDNESGDVLPYDYPFAPWLWWEMVTFDHTLVNSIDFAYMNSSNTGGTQRKAQGMRKNTSGVNQVLRVAYQTFGPTSSANQVQFQFSAAAQAVILLP